MDYHIFHWAWYLLGSIFSPRLTIAIALSIHGKSLNIPTIFMIIIWTFAILGLCETQKEE